MSRPEVTVRPLSHGDLDAADEIMRLAFGTMRGLSDPSEAFGDAELVRTRFLAAPDSAWVAESESDVVGSVFATRWGTLGFFGPLTVDPAFWGRGVGSLLMEPVLDAFARWELRQAGLFTFPESAKHIGLYQKHGFWPRFVTSVMAKAVESRGDGFTLLSDASTAHRAAIVSDVRVLTDAVFAGLDLEREILAAQTQGIGDTVLLDDDGELAGVAVCHRGAGSEAGSGACYVKFGAVRPGEGATERFERLLAACESFAVASDSARLVAGVNTGRLDAYRRMLRNGFRAELIGLSMCRCPDQPGLDGPHDYVIDDLR
jgi:GNAT superfamily N-acetyltransferase